MAALQWVVTFLISEQRFPNPSTKLPITKGLTNQFHKERALSLFASRSDIGPGSAHVCLLSEETISVF